MTNKRLWIAITVLIWIVAIATWSDRCGQAWLRFGLDLDRCPDGELRQTAELSAASLRRAGRGRVTLRATAHYATVDGERSAALPAPRDVVLTLGAAGKPAAPVPVASWSRAGDTTSAELQLPEVPDGDYQLRATYRTTLGTGEVTLPLALYAPARIHVITDRPLYQAGNTVRFRAVVVRAADLAPIEHRPGRWVVTNPEREVVLDEAAPSGPWGVVAGSFPLDKAAASGTWTIAWRSASDMYEVPITVHPFTLPRFRVDAVADQTFYRPGARPVIKGAVLYSSGAPVAGARLEVTWRVAGGWPPPTAWLAGLLPTRAETAGNGRFTLALPEVPDDLQGQATLTAQIAAIDPAGDRVAGAASVLLSQDGIVVSAETELRDGLVESFNNRLYLRVATPDGRVVANQRITVKRAWQPGDRGTVANLDEDGVASLQLDPGAPVNLVIPAAPYRPAPRPPAVSRGEIRELINGQGAALADQLALDRWLAPLAPCAAQVDGAAQAIKLALRVDRGGAVLAAGAGSSAVERCAVAVARAQRLPVGGDRLYTLELHFTDPGLPQLTAQVQGALDVPAGLAEQITALARGTRSCLPAVGGRLASMLTWRVRAGARDVETGWLPDPTAPPSGSAASPGRTGRVDPTALPSGSAASPGRAGRVDPTALPSGSAASPGSAGRVDPAEPEGHAALGCVTARFAGARIALAAPAEADAMGVVRFGVEPAASGAEARPQPTTMLGYELAVTAAIEGAPSTIVRIAPGAVPPLRLRVTPVLARPGDEVVAELIRGPAFTGELPAKLDLVCLGTAKPAQPGDRTAPPAGGADGRAALTVDKDHRARITVPATAEGWCTVSAGGLRAALYVRPAAQLAVSVTPRQDRYKPGDRAELEVKTSIAGVGHEAAVGLFGVDDSLAQLVPLPGPDALAALRPQPTTSHAAFDVLDGEALALGRIRGANAAAATVLRVTATPAPQALDATVSGRAESAFDPEIELTDRFYVVLAELHAQVRAWEASPRADKMTPATMARLWRAALDACAARGQRVDDAYGRRLRLSRLPADLLVLTDPRAVVVVATRLTEDVENWPAWVAREQP